MASNDSFLMTQLFFRNSLSILIKIFSKNSYAILIYIKRYHVSLKNNRKHKFKFYSKNLDLRHKVKLGCIKNRLKIALANFIYTYKILRI